MSVSPATTSKLLTAMRHSQRALSARELHEVTGLAYATLSKALEHPEIRKVEGFPVRFDIEGETTPTDISIGWHSNLRQLKDTGRTIAVAELHTGPSVVNLYDRVVGLIPMALPSKLAPTMDPDELATELGNFSIFLANLSVALQSHANDPAWYTALGGEPDVFRSSES